MGRHRRSAPSKTLNLIAAAGLAAVAIITITIAITGSGSSSAQLASRAGAARPDPDPPRRPLGRTSRDDVRRPIAVVPQPEPEPSEAPSVQPVQKKRQRQRIVSRGACEASYYGKGGHTANGEAFDPAALTAAHRTLPIGSKVRVTNRNNDRSVVVRINDRGPFVPGRCLDLSSAAMHAVGGVGSGVIPVRYEVFAKI